MDKSESMIKPAGQAKNPLSYTLIALGVVLLGMGLPAFFATSQVTRLVGDSLAQVPVIVGMGLVIVVSGAAMIAIGLRKR